jgi:hypothetical protein
MSGGGLSGDGIQDFAPPSSDLLNDPNNNRPRADGARRWLNWCGGAYENHSAITVNYGH